MRPPPLLTLAVLLSAAALAVAVAAAYRAGRQAAGRAGSPDETDFLHRLRAAEPAGGHYVRRASDVPGENALLVSARPLDADESRGLRTQRGAPGWQGVFWVRRLRPDDDQEAWRRRVEEWGPDLCFVRSGLVFFGDVAEARKCCDLAGI